MNDWTQGLHIKLFGVVLNCFGRTVIVNKFYLRVSNIDKTPSLSSVHARRHDLHDLA
jgi:hypothetical protein